jgi:hypothetical protein
LRLKRCTDCVFVAATIVFDGELIHELWVLVNVLLGEPAVKSTGD